MSFWRPRKQHQQPAMEPEPVAIPAASGWQEAPARAETGDPTPPPPLMRVRPGAPSPAGAFRRTRLGREVRSLLASLGRTRSEVAATLEAAGVKGAPCDAGRSPLGLYLAAVIGADPAVRAVRVGDRSVSVHLRAWWRASVLVDLPFAAREFMIAFDQACYPGLVAGA